MFAYMLTHYICMGWDGRLAYNLKNTHKNTDKQK